MEGANFEFGGAMDFSHINFGADYTAQNQSFQKPAEGNTNAAFFFGDEGIDATSSFDSSFDAMNSLYTMPETGFAMQQNLTLDETLGGASAWNTQLPTTMDDFAISNHAFDASLQPFNTNNNNKRSLHLDTHDFPQSKRHASADVTTTSSFASPFMAPTSAAASAWTVDTNTSPSDSVEVVGLTDEAADVCAMWFSKYAVLPSDRHIDSLSQLTGESAPAIRQWFGQMLKQGMAGHDSAYKSQTSLSQVDQFFGDATTRSNVGSGNITINNDTTNEPLRGGKKGCRPTDREDLLCRDASKIYQCTRKCGKRYVRKCDWKRNEEEGYPSKAWSCSLCKSQGAEKVKPCFRKYHFAQHFRNIHPGVDCAEYEQASIVQSETSFPRRCGFCTYRFKSRRDRIDHIADHFKQGKCMLDWNDDDDDNNGSDDMDDDDSDQPGGDGFQGDSGSFGAPPGKQCPPRSSGSGGSNTDNGGFGPFGGFGSFQLSSRSDNAGTQSSCASQHIIQQSVEPMSEDGSTRGQCLSSVDSEKQRERHETTAEHNENAVARDAVTRTVIAKDGKQKDAGSATTEALATSCCSVSENIDIITPGLSEQRKPTVQVESLPETQDEHVSSPKLLSQDILEDYRTKRNNSTRGEASNELGISDSIVEITSKTKTHDVLDQFERAILAPDDMLLSRDKDKAVQSRGRTISLSDAQEFFRLLRDRCSQNTPDANKDNVGQSQYSTLAHHTYMLQENAFAKFIPRSFSDSQDLITVQELEEQMTLQVYEVTGSPLSPNFSANIIELLGDNPESQSLFSLINDAKALPSDIIDLGPVSSIKPVLTEGSMLSTILNRISSSALNDKLAVTSPRRDSAQTALNKLLSMFKQLSSAQQLEALTLERQTTDRLQNEELSGPSIDLSLTTGSKTLNISAYLKEETSSITFKLQEIIAPTTDTYLSSEAFLSIQLLGTGGFSTVDEVVHQKTKLRISRKTLKNREHSALEEVKREVSVLQKLRHPHIIRFLGAYSKGDKVSILLSPVAETTLAVWLENCYADRPLDLAATVEKMFGCLSSSLRYLHEQRPVVKHCDIKPQNILVMQGEHGVPHVVLSDFGISSSEDESLGQDSKPLTRQYCAPEVPAGASREQESDIWSLGCVFVEMLAAALSQDNAQWLDFRKEFSGREGKYYWQEVPRLHEWLSSFVKEAATSKDEIVLSTVKSMLNSDPANRPSAASLTIVFTPASCCLSWPNENISFPGPLEEREIVKMLVHNDSVDVIGELHTGEVHNCDRSFARARDWLHQCTHDHEVCRRQAGSMKLLPTRLVDIRPELTDDNDVVRIVNSADLGSDHRSQVDYVALSHVWSDNDLTLSQARLLTMQDNIPRDALPKSVNEAISAAKAIGYHYLWVDSLCVVQDSEEDKKKECATMAAVYRNAGLTIVAKPNDDKENGSSVTEQACRDTTVKHENETKPTFPSTWQSPGFAWDTRAWSLQERLLSRRILHLASGQMYWECNSLKASETFPRGLPSLVWEKAHIKTTTTTNTMTNKHNHHHHTHKTNSLSSVSSKSVTSRPIRTHQGKRRGGDRSTSLRSISSQALCYHKHDALVLYGEGNVGRQGTATSGSDQTCACHCGVNKNTQQRGLLPVLGDDDGMCNNGFDGRRSLIMLKGGEDEEGGSTFQFQGLDALNDNVKSKIPINEKGLRLGTKANSHGNGDGEEERYSMNMDVDTDMCMR